jgi:hypothetical protein
MEKQNESEPVFCVGCFFIDPPGEKGVWCLNFRAVARPFDKPRNAVCYVPDDKPHVKRDLLIN